MSGAGWVIVTGFALLAIGSAIIPTIAIIDRFTGKIRQIESVELLFDTAVAPLLFVGAITTFGGTLFVLWQWVAA